VVPPRGRCGISPEPGSDLLRSATKAAAALAPALNPLPAPSNPTDAGDDDRTLAIVTTKLASKGYGLFPALVSCRRRRTRS